MNEFTAEKERKQSRERDLLMFIASIKKQPLVHHLRHDRQPALPSGGAPAVSKACPFDDVGEEAYYKNAIIWAEGNGIVCGYDESTFVPEDRTTREQMAAFL